MLRRRRMGRRRERYEWLGFGSGGPQTVAANARVDQVLITQAQLEEFPKALWVRTMGTLFISPATAPVAATGYIVGAGLYHTEIGAGGGIAAFDPFAQLDHRFQWWTVCYPQLGGNGAADSNASRWAGYFSYFIDQRHKERLQDNDEIVMSVANSALSGASIQFALTVRILLAVGAK